MFSEKLFIINSIMMIVLLGLDFLLGWKQKNKGMKGKLVLPLMIGIPIMYFCLIMMFATIYMIAKLFLSEGNEGLIPIVTCMPNVVVLFTLIKTVRRK